MRRKTGRTLWLVLLATACGEPEPEEVRWVPSTPYEQYVESIRAAGLGNTAVVRDWIAAGDRALEQALPVFTPFTQIGYFDPSEPRAAGYRIEALRGQKIIVDFEAFGSDSARLFVDLFREPRNGPGTPLHVASGDSTTGTIEFVAYWDGAYLLRLQPELLRGGRYRLAVRNAASLSFPVSGHDSRSIQSVFGDPRDGGSRSHQGVDIFAGRYTPVVSPTKGRVTFVGTNRLGGNVVWLRDTERGYSYYFAHLQVQSVSRGQSVDVGDTLGLVGNSGNARTTPTHLHFGIYRRGSGAVDPYNFVHNPAGVAAPLVADTTPLGEWARIARRGTSLRSSPVRRADALRTLDQDTPVRLMAGIGSWYEVELPSNEIGFIPAATALSTEQPLSREVVTDGGLVRRLPQLEVSPSDSLAPGTTVDVLGRFAGYSLITSPRGNWGWIADGDLGGRLATRNRPGQTEGLAGGGGGR